MVDADEAAFFEGCLAEYEEAMREAPAPVTHVESLCGLPADFLAALSAGEFTADEVSEIIRTNVVPADKSDAWSCVVQFAHYDGAEPCNDALAAIVAYRRKAAA